MNIKNQILTLAFYFALTSIVLLFAANKTFAKKTYHNTIKGTISGIIIEGVDPQETKDAKPKISPYIIKGSSMEKIRGRIGYDLDGRDISTKHFALRVTTPVNPFGPHKHEKPELWFIVKGKAKVLIDGVEYEVEENDLIILDPWIEHGLRSDSEVTWICLGYVFINH